VDGDRGALLAREIRGSGAGVYVGLVLLLGDGIDRERDRGGRNVRNHVHAVPVEPLPSDARAYVRLVLVIAGHQLDGEAVRAEILDSLTGARGRGRAGHVAIRPRHVAEDADPDGVALGTLGARRAPEWHGSDHCRCQ
jgi:hypothetical protein